MGDVVIRAEGLGKRYQLGQGVDLTRNFREALAAFPRKLARIAGGQARAAIEAARLTRTEAAGGAATAADPETPPGTFWALRDVNFEINRGEVVGIIGRNGAGKSTLLKVLSRITAPTTGQAIVHGRLASLLEVGTGFHPELTGRENVYLNGAILGMRKVEIARKFDEIVAFAEVEKFLDTPVKRYSSGMYVRLAFAVAAHLEPEVLVVDEVLAVGDAAFQKKCLGRMNEVAQGGRTVLFVSHNMAAVSSLTKRCLLLNSGKIVSNDITELVLRTYNSETNQDTYRSAPDELKPTITGVEVITSEPGNVQAHAKSWSVRFQISFPKVTPHCSISFQIIDELSQPITHMWFFASEHNTLGSVPGSCELTCTVPKLRLYLGNYSLRVHFSSSVFGEKLATLDNVCQFSVVMTELRKEFEWQPKACLYLEDCQWSLGR